MSDQKTKPTKVSVTDFIETFTVSEARKADAYQLIEYLSEWTGYEPVMWGPSIIGFGSYHYQYESGREGDSPILAFSPRKAALTLYVHSDTEKTQALLEKLGKYKRSKVCLYLNKLSDIEPLVLKDICLETMAYINTHHHCACKQ